MKSPENLIKLLPDPDAAGRFAERLKTDHPGLTNSLKRDEGLYSDLLAIAAFSPLLSTTILQNPEYVPWLKRARKNSAVLEKYELLESLARFALTNSTLEPGVLLARFRRRELIRIYLKDLRGLGSIGEVTEEISHLADAILEYALQLATQEMENRFGAPLALDEKEKQIQSVFCIVALGKLGSKELNYASDIDLLFLYSDEGSTSGHGRKGAITNREYFIKLSEKVVKLVGMQTGEGAAYRVDMRLRPHGRVGKLAVSLKEATRYYTESARMWEKQVLIRSRASAGDQTVFDQFFESVENLVFSTEMSVSEALRNVKLSKEMINAEKSSDKGFDVKLGLGGIREIEFIAQALQLAYGGTDSWLRVPHTLISLTRLADRGLITESELTDLFDAYTFLRRLEHRLQMEQGLQTHLVPDDLEKRLVISRRMEIDFVADFNSQLDRHANNVDAVFTRVLGENEIPPEPSGGQTEPLDKRKPEDRVLGRLFDSIDKSNKGEQLEATEIESLRLLITVAPAFAEMITANPGLVDFLPDPGDRFADTDFSKEFLRGIQSCSEFPERLSVLRRIWSRNICRIAAFEVFEEIDYFTAKRVQTDLAESSISTAVLITRAALATFYKQEIETFPFAVLGLGKLGGGGMDYGSDLDLLLVYDDEAACPVPNLSHAEFYSKAVEFFVTCLSSMTRDGTLYRVDLRLRPYGKKGTTSIGIHALTSYLVEHANVWEWLAYVKLRGVHGENQLATRIEQIAKNCIHSAAVQIEGEILRSKSYEMRLRLQEQKSGRIRSDDVDIKFGEGGLQDVYFAIRYLQLRDNIPDAPENRSTVNTLSRLRENESLSTTDYNLLKDGYTFLSELDHNLRLNVGRSTRVRAGHSTSIDLAAKRMRLGSVPELMAQLTEHRQNIREAFDHVFEM